MIIIVTEMRAVKMKTALPGELAIQVLVEQGKKEWKQSLKLDESYAWNLEIKRKKIIGSLG